MDQHKRGIRQPKSLAGPEGSPTHPQEPEGSLTFVVSSIFIFRKHKYAMKNIDYNYRDKYCRITTNSTKCDRTRHLIKYLYIRGHMSILPEGGFGETTTNIIK